MCYVCSTRFFKEFFPKLDLKRAYTSLILSKKQEEEIRYRFDHVRKTPDDIKELRRIFAKFARAKTNNGNKSWTSKAVNSSSFIYTRNQVVMAKLHYGKNLNTHLKFLNTYMPQKNKKDVKIKPELFGNVTVEEYKKRISLEKRTVYYKGKRKSVSNHYKWVLAPETNLTEDVLKEYTKCFVKRVEERFGRKLLWQAVIHQNTAHPHVHLLINGNDFYGQYLGFPREFIRNGARELSSKILTDIVGERDISLVNSAKERTITSERWTDYDKSIKAMLNDSENELYTGAIAATSGLGPNILRRLKYIEELGLAEFKTGNFYLKKGYEEQLKIRGRYNNFIDAKRRIPKMFELKFYKPGDAKIQGVIKYIYSMNDEDIWKNAVVIENKELKTAWFVPMREEQSKNLIHKYVSVQQEINLNKNGLPVHEYVVGKDFANEEIKFDIIENNESKVDQNNEWDGFDYD